LVPEQFACPYCDATLNANALSCRFCGRDLTSILPLLRRTFALDQRVSALESRLNDIRDVAPATPQIVPAAGFEPSVFPASTGQRHLLAIPVGFIALLAAYSTVVLWLDLPLSILRFASMAIPFITGFAYFGERPRLASTDVFVCVLFAIAAVATMNALLGWIDSIPIAPQDVAAWRETFFYALSIGASMFSGMLFRVLKVALAARGLTTLPRLREGLLAVNKNVPMDTLKAIELTIILVGTAMSAVTGLLAGILGLSK